VARDEGGRSRAGDRRDRDLRTWVRKAEVDAGQRPGVTSEKAAEIKRRRAKLVLDVLDMAL
jgi:hypothetical protein